MNKAFCSAVLWLVVSTQISIACPTCVGQIKKDSAPFFADECYIYTNHSHQTGKKDLKINSQNPGVEHENHQ